MTHLTITGALDINYNFPAGTNNGKISTQTDNLSGETVTYQYDSLNRLLSATSNQSWSETYGFDGFGNLLSKTGTGGAPTLSQSVSASNNQIVGQSYDSNGNQASGPLGSVSYDAENRIASVSSAGAQYAYDSQNKRIWSSTLSNGNLTQTFYYYGVNGQKLGIYPLTLAFINNTTPVMTDNSNVKLSTFFGSKRIGAYDRLGTAKYNANGQPQSFYPYGEDRGTIQPNDSLKFATYTRDSATGLDYADQRYYANNWGRFMRPDPSGSSLIMANPASWNRYAYVLGDPTNSSDPSGLCASMFGGISMGLNPAPNSAGSDFVNEQGALGADAGYPYSDEGKLSSGFGVVFSSSISTAVALATLQYALSSNSGSIDVIAYSGGAQAFADALTQLSPADQARIGIMLYIAPGMLGTIPTLGRPQDVFVVEGQDWTSEVAAFGTAIPSSIPSGNVLTAPCDHTQLACLFQSSPLAQIISHGPCDHPKSFYRPYAGAPDNHIFPMYDNSNPNFFGYNLFTLQDLMVGGSSNPAPTPIPSTTFSYGPPPQN
jgi:RHS repeat-associated protein